MIYKYKYIKRLTVSPQMSNTGFVAPMTPQTSAPTAMPILIYDNDNNHHIGFDNDNDHRIGFSAWW